MKSPRCGHSRQAALLLEVVVSFAILTAAIGVLATQLVNGLKMTTFSETQLRASLLADQIVAQVELDPNMQQRISELNQDGELEDRFGDANPGYFWRVGVKPVETDRTDLFVLTIEVLHQPDPERPEEIDGAEVERQLVRLQAAPAKIDLATDAGMTDDMISQLQQSLPFADFDPRAIDLHKLVALDADAMLQLVPMLMTLMAQVGGAGDILSQLSGGGTPNLDGLPPDAADQLRQLMELAQQANGGQAAPPPSPPGGGRPGGGNKPPDGGGRRPNSGVPDGVNVGKGSGPNGEYTIEDLMRMRDEYERSKGGGG